MYYTVNQKKKLFNLSITFANTVLSDFNNSFTVADRN